MLALDPVAHRSAAREIIAYEGTVVAHGVLNAGRGSAELRAALELELRRLPDGEPNRSSTLRRWRAEARP